MATQMPDLQRQQRLDAKILPVGYGQVVTVELVAIEIHEMLSPTSWVNISAEQRNNTRRHANALINEALDFWDKEQNR